MGSARRSTDRSSAPAHAALAAASALRRASATILSSLLVSFADSGRLACIIDHGGGTCACLGYDSALWNIVRDRTENAQIRWAGWSI